MSLLADGEDQVLTPRPPTPEFLTEDFLSATTSRMKILTKENLVGDILLPLEFPGLSRSW